MKIEKDPLQHLPLGTPQKNKTLSSGEKSNSLSRESDGSATSGAAATVEIHGSAHGAAAEMSVKEATAIAQQTAAAIAQKTETAGALHHSISSKRAEELLR